MNKISDWTVRLLTLATLATGVTCGGRSALLDPLADMDGDGVTNEDDCAPCDPTVSGDKDDDGYYDARCWDEESNDGDPIAGCGMVSQYFAPNDDGPELRDCDDEDACVHPLDPPTEAGASPPCLVVPEQPRGDDVTVYECAFIDLSWASDGKDNDCDGLVDGVSDYDGDGVISQDWAEAKGLSFEPGELDCDDCRALVRPTIDERATVDVDGESCPIYAYDDVDNDCDGQDVTDVDQDGYVGGWHPDSPCGLQVNATLAEGMSPDATTPDNGTLIDRLLAAGQDAVDCEDTTLEKHPDAYERCDDEDWNCSFPRDEDWSRHAEPDYTFDGFTAIEEGAFGYAEDQPAYYIYVDIDGVGMGASPEEAIGPTPDLDELTSLTEPDSLLTPLRRAAYYLDRCPVLRIAPGTYQESLTLSRLGTEDADTGGPDSGDTDGGDTDGGDTGDLEGPSLDSREVAFTAPDGGVTWDGVQAPALSALQAAGDALRVEGIEFIGGDDVDTSYEGSCVVVYAGGLRVQDTRFTGCESWREGGGLFVAATEDVTLENVSFDACSSRAAGGGLYLATLQEATLSGVRASGSSAAGDGGGVYVAATGAATLSDIDASACTSEGAGGGLYLSAADIQASELQLEDNRASQDGGGGFITSDGAIALSGLRIGNTAAPSGGYNAGGDGGGLLVDGESVEIYDLISTGALAEGRGGTLLVNSRDETYLEDILIDCSDQTVATEGGGAWIQARDLTLTELSVQRCRVTGDGGGLSAFASGATTLDGAITLSDNQAGLDGGGMALVVNGDLSAPGTPSFEDNRAGQSGGGLFVLGDGGASFADSLKLTGNQAGGDGGGAYLLLVGDLSLSGGATATDNQADRDGGGAYVYAGGAVEADGQLTLQQNSADGDGGGLWLLSDQLDLASLVASANAADGDGGGAHVTTLTLSASEARIRAGTIKANTGRDGAGLWVAPVGLSLGELTFSANIGEGAGGGLWVDGTTVTLNDLSFSTNEADGDGGGAWIDATTATLTDPSFSGNNSGGSGGGAWIDGGKATLNQANFSANTADEDGGGVWIAADEAIFQALTLSSNQADEDGGGLRLASSDIDLDKLTASVNAAEGDGGGAYILIAEGGEATLDDLTLSSNRAGDSGGGLFLSGSGTARLDTFEFSENVSSGDTGDAGGGAVYATELAEISIQNGTISGEAPEINAGGYGGGVAINVVDFAWLDEVVFSELAASGAGGALSVQTVSTLYLGTDEDGSEEGDESGTVLDKARITVEDSFSKSVGGGIFLRSIDDMVMNRITLTYNNIHNLNPEPPKGVQLYLNQVDGVMDELNIGYGGTNAFDSLCGTGCRGQTALYQTGGDITMTNSAVHHNTMRGWAILLSQTARMDIRNAAITDHPYAAGIWAKNSSTLLGTAMTLADNEGNADPDKDHHKQAIRGGQGSNLFIGCSVMYHNLRGLYQYSSLGHFPGMFCVVSRENHPTDTPDSVDDPSDFDLDYHGAPTTTDIGDPTDGTPDDYTPYYVCLEEPAEGKDDLAFTPLGEWSYVSEVPEDCGDCLHEYDGTGSSVSSGVLYPQEETSTEDGTDATPQLKYECGGGSDYPIGFDPRYYLKAAD